VGGLRIREPAADLAVALAVASSLTGVPLGAVAAFGEVSLTGEVRPVAHARRRRREAARLGFDEVVAPQRGRESSLGTLIRIVRLVS
ncbi:MAG: S16 family serine protease, partial [Acidimicrobiia bacterium]